MTHPLVTIEETATVQPQKIQTTHVGGINYGAALVEMFADENGEATKVKQLQAMAQVITYEEFSKAVKHAKDIADATDKANGFVKAEGAKSGDAYTITFTRKNPGEGKAVPFGLAIHGDHASGRFHQTCS